MIPDVLNKEIANLEKVGYQIETILHGNIIYLIFKDFILPDNFNISKTDLLVRTNVTYPSCAFDMFWVDESLLLSNNRMPKAAEVVEEHCNRKWRRFSIHPYHLKRWNPAEDNLEVYLSYINNRLIQNV